jgi:hypothetical protein
MQHYLITNTRCTIELSVHTTTLVHTTETSCCYTLSGVNKCPLSSSVNTKFTCQTIPGKTKHTYCTHRTVTAPHQPIPSHHNVCDVQAHGAWGQPSAI